jgi:C-terminal peptidase prc
MIKTRNCPNAMGTNLSNESNHVPISQIKEITGEKTNFLITSDPGRLNIIPTILMLWLLSGCSWVDYSGHQTNSYEPAQSRNYPRYIPQYEDTRRNTYERIWEDSDPYHRTQTAEQFQKEQKRYNQYEEWFWLTLNIENKKVIVASIDKDSLAIKTKLQVGDVIKSINWKKITSSVDIGGLIKNAKSIKIVISRNGKSKVLTIHKSKIFEPTIETEKFKNGIWYVKLKSFNHYSADEFKKSKDLINSKWIIIDLRWNGGWLLDTAINLTALFLKKWKTITYIKEFDKDKYSQIYTNQDWEFSNKKIVIIVDRRSASASELFTQALSDNHRAVVIWPSWTFWKWVGQTTSQTSDGTYETKTTFEYLSPNKKRINNVWIQPLIRTENCLEDAIKILSAEINWVIKKKIRI